jgi:hypothetical protein
VHWLYGIDGVQFRTWYSYVMALLAISEKMLAHNVSFSNRAWKYSSARIFASFHLFL